MAHRLLALLALVVVPLGRAQDRAVSFARDVAPILTGKCLQCHDARQRMGGLDLSTRERALAAIVPGDAAASKLYRRVTGREEPRMPFGGELSNVEITTLERWIAAGASWDGASAAALGRSAWVFRKPVRPATPAVDAPWSAHPIDAFVKQMLDAKGLVPALPADRRTLARRAYLDLVGLLPTPDEVETFVRDPAPDAFAALVDRLLASPHYGERWGRHWLDVARYADSWGHIHDDDNPNAWRYRDYVIRSLNADKPYTRFILEQLAGDELDEVTFDGLVATSFNRIGPRVLFREKQNPHYRYDYLDDLIGTTSRAFLGLTVSCARCHDHKFDPISQADYHRMMSAFFPFVDYDHPLALGAVVAEHARIRSEVEREAKPLRARIRQIEEPYRRRLFDKRLLTFPPDVQAAVRTPEEQRTPGQQLLAGQILSISLGGRRDLGLGPEDRTAVAKLEAELREIEKRLPAPLPVAAGIRDGDYRFTPDGPGDEPVPGTTAKRFRLDFAGSFLPEPGNPYMPPPLCDVSGKPIAIEPGFLSAIAESKLIVAHPPADGRPTSGRRRALAEWLASDQNPLTARVMANRIWHHHFGRGIVATPSNFGATGTPPTHPELLDWLATELVRSGWSWKAMHRLIMTSRTYQMASAFSQPRNIESDPDNHYLWRFPVRRLEAEIIRDVILSASGQLNLEAGGPPFFPAVAPSVHEDAKKVGKWMLTKEEPATWRRSIYSYWKRALKFPMFEVFDQPDTMVTCERRNTTTVPTQALTLMNNEFVLLQSRHLATRVRENARVQPADAGAEIRALYRVALGRDPSPKEVSSTRAFLGRQREYHAGRASGDPGYEALVDLCNVVLNLNEFLYIN
jgi:hypothetical protein